MRARTNLAGMIQTRGFAPGPLGTSTVSPDRSGKLAAGGGTGRDIRGHSGLPGGCRAAISRTTATSCPAPDATRRSGKDRGAIPRVRPPAGGGGPGGAPQPPGVVVGGLADRPAESALVDVGHTPVPRTRDTRGCLVRSTARAGYRRDRPLEGTGHKPVEF